MNRYLNVRYAAIVLGCLAILIIFVSHVGENDGVIDLGKLWKALWPNVGTGLADIVVTVLVIDALNERRAKQQELDELALQMGSPDNGFAVEAARKLRVHGSLMDGSLRHKVFNEANLQGANLQKANLQNTKMIGAKLQSADLTSAQLQGADLGGAKFQKVTDDADRAATLWDANLQGAILGSAVLDEVNFGCADLRGADLSGASLRRATMNDKTKFDEHTTLPDGKKWTPETDMKRYTDISGIW